jgi:hypothetical protein
MGVGLHFKHPYSIGENRVVNNVRCEGNDIGIGDVRATVDIGNAANDRTVCVTVEIGKAEDVGTDGKGICGCADVRHAHWDGAEQRTDRHLVAGPVQSDVAGQAYRIRKGDRAVPAEGNLSATLQRRLQSCLCTIGHHPTCTRGLRANEEQSQTPE